MVSVAELIGKEVLGSDGYNIGKISDIQMDEKNWRITSLEVHLNKDVAEEHNLRHWFRKTQVLVSVDHVRGVGDRIVLNGSKDDILKLIASSPIGSQKDAQAVINNNAQQSQAASGETGGSTSTQT